MKKVLILLIFVIISLCKNDNVFAQSDSLKVEYKQESIDSSDFAVRRKYKYLDIILKDEKNLIKIGVQPSIFYTDNTFELIPHLIFEKKISPAWSLIFDNEIGYSYNRFSNSSVNDKIFKFSLNIGTRYYYGINKAIQKKISGNNFNRNYFEFNITGFPSIQKYKKTYLESNGNGNNTIPLSGTQITYLTSAQISWGIQRRLSNYTFIDAKMLVGNNLQDYIVDSGSQWFVGLNIIFGFGYNVKCK